MSLVKVCGADDVPVGEARRFPVGDRLIAIVNLGEDGIRAIDAICSHERYFLDEGEVDPDLGTIECPKHGSTFDLETGKPRSLPAVSPVDVFDVKIEDDSIWIEAPGT